MSTAIFALAAAAAVSPPSADRVTSDAAAIAVMCDPVGYRFSIRANATKEDLDATYPIMKIIPVDALFDPRGLPGWTGQTELLAPLIRYERCGPYTLKLEGDAYNLYSQGESGAYEPFAALTIIRGNSTLLPEGSSPLRLTECDRMLPPARPCPSGYAVRVDGSYDDRKKVVHFVLTRRSNEYDEPAERRVRVDSFDKQDNLELWRPDRMDQ